MLPLTILTTHTHTAAAKNKKGVKELLFWALLFQVTRKEKKKSRIFVIFSCFEMCENLKKKFANFYGTKSCYFFEDPLAHSVL